MGKNSVHAIIAMIFMFMAVFAACSNNSSENDERSVNRINLVDHSTTSCSSMDRPDDAPEFVIIDGVRYCTSLTELNLSGNHRYNPSIVLTENDIEPLRYMQNLTSLTIEWQSITDFSVISELESLTHLTLTGNGISDLSTIAGLENLTYLSLGYNKYRTLPRLVHYTILRA